MKVLALLILACSLWESKGYPYNYYPYYHASNMDTLSVGSSDSTQGGMVLSRYYNPYYSSGYGGGMAAFMFKPQQTQEVPKQYYTQPKPQETYGPPEPQTQEVYVPPKPQTQEVYGPPKPQTQEVYIPPKTQYQGNYVPSQENEVYPPEKAPTTEVELSDFTTESITTAKFANQTPLIPVIPIAPELAEVEEVEDTKPRKRVSKKRPVKKPVEEEDEEGDDEYSRMPMGALFPMFFGYGRNGGGGGGATAIANAYSGARGGVASSHATAFGDPQPDLRNFKTPDVKKYREC